MMTVKQLLTPEITSKLSDAIRTRHWFASQVPTSMSLCAQLLDLLLPVLPDYPGPVIELGDGGTGSYATGSYPIGIILPKEIPDALARGATVRLRDIHKHILEIGEMLSAIAEQQEIQKGKLQCNLYISEQNSGIPVHYDAHNILVLQLKGSKTWYLAPNTRATPPTENYLHTGDLDSSNVVDAPPAWGSEPWECCMLNPGSILGVAAGVWHTTTAEGYSLSLTFGFGGIVGEI